MLNQTRKQDIPDTPGAYPCPVENCGKVFGKKDSLRKHALNVHDKKFNMSILPKKVQNKI